MQVKQQSTVISYRDWRCSTVLRVFIILLCLLPASGFGCTMDAEPVDNDAVFTAAAEAGGCHEARMSDGCCGEAEAGEALCLEHCQNTGLALPVTLCTLSVLSHPGFIETARAIFDSPPNTLLRPPAYS